MYGRTEAARRYRMRFLWICLFALGLIAPAHAQADAGRMEAIKALRGGGHVIVFRHGATHADQADTDPLNITNVAKRHQPSVQRRPVRRAIGEAMRKLNFPVGEVVTSQFNRAVETGTLLGFGAVTSTPEITEGGVVVT